MSTLKDRLFSNWHYMRYIRFMFGALLLILAIGTRDLSSLPFSIFFLFTAITGVWCCDAEGNYSPASDRPSEKTVTIE
jgi:hypothetical protein